jgi:hypothetical protein
VRDPFDDGPSDVGTIGRIQWRNEELRTARGLFHARPNRRKLPQPEAVVARAAVLSGVTAAVMPSGPKTRA